MGLRDRLRKLVRDADGEIVTIPQQDGPPARFPASASADAYLSAIRRTCGEDVPEHPLSAAARTSSAAEWRDSVVAAPEEVPTPPEDLSEP